ncbi:MAG: DUF2712 domain-containing protein [Acutalibacteraceae bacterium]|nr:DUF2712 domain-containing protein [Acutalibacteraceae bacterium]
MTGRFKKFVSIIISLMVVCSAFGLYASAGNTSLSEYSFALSPSADYRHTLPRPKEDASSVYARLDGATNDGAYFKAYGTHYAYNTDYEYDLTIGGNIHLFPGQSGYIMQTIYENGYYYAVLGVKNAGTYTRSIYGVWSPDSSHF